jgi:hypothetical protein
MRATDWTFWIGLSIVFGIASLVDSSSASATDALVALGGR